MHCQRLAERAKEIIDLVEMLLKCCRLVAGSHIATGCCEHWRAEQRIGEQAYGEWRCKVFSDDTEHLSGMADGETDLKRGALT